MKERNKYFNTAFQAIHMIVLAIELLQQMLSNNSHMQAIGKLNSTTNSTKAN